VIAVLLGLVAAACFGAMTVAVREGLLRVPDAAAGSFVTATVGLLVTLPAALASGDDGLSCSSRSPSSSPAPPAQPYW
jgi:drug/metabolite transporter (DMT)-like permease